MASVRIWHNYLGVFIAPSVLFFSISGTWQLFSLHEGHGTYAAPAIIEKLSSVHKDQVFERSDRDKERDDAATARKNQASHAKPAHDAEEEDQPSIATYLLKWFFCLVSLALTVTTLFGLWIGLRHPVRKRTGWVLFIAGAVVPVVLTAI